VSNHSIELDFNNFQSIFVKTFYLKDAVILCIKYYTVFCHLSKLQKKSVFAEGNRRPQFLPQCANQDECLVL